MKNLQITAVAVDWDGKSCHRSTTSQWLDGFLADLKLIQPFFSVKQISSLEGSNISHQWERKLIFPTAFGWDILVPRSSSRIQVLAWFETSVCSLFWWIAWREKRCPNNFCWWLCRSVTSMGLMQNSMLIYMQKPADGNVNFLQEFRDLKKLFAFFWHFVLNRIIIS